MPRVLVPIAPGFEEIETATVVDVLRRAENVVVLAGLDGPGAHRGSRGIPFVPDEAFEAAEGPWDLVVLPGGMGNAERLAGDGAVRALLRARFEAGEPVAAICAAPMALDAAGVLPSGDYTCYPGIEARLQASGRRGDRVVQAGPVITSQGPATAMEFALALVERLQGSERRAQVAQALLYD